MMGTRPRAAGGGARSADRLARARRPARRLLPQRAVSRPAEDGHRARARTAGRCEAARAERDGGNALTCPRGESSCDQDLSRPRIAGRCSANADRAMHVVDAGLPGGVDEVGLARATRSRRSVRRRAPGRPSSRRPCRAGRCARLLRSKITSEGGRFCISASAPSTSARRRPPRPGGSRQPGSST